MPLELEDANKILSASINVDSDRNWFAYTTRIQVRLDIADTVIQHNQERAKSSFENAKKDGHICFKSNNTRRDMTVLAETFPSLRDYGPEFVKKKNTIYMKH